MSMSENEEVTLEQSKDDSSSLSSADTETFKPNSDIEDKPEGLDQLAFKTEIPEQPVTQERQPYIPSAEDRLTDLGVARATIAASKEHPNGTTEDEYAQRHQHQTVSKSLAICYP